MCVLSNRKNFPSPLPLRLKRILTEKVIEHRSECVASIYVYKRSLLKERVERLRNEVFIKPQLVDLDGRCKQYRIYIERSVSKKEIVVIDRFIVIGYYYISFRCNLIFGI